MIENWKPIPGWPYEASDLGRIRNASTLRVLKPGKRGSRYLCVEMHGPNGEYLREYVHRLILLTFVGPCPDGHEAAHRDDIAHDNRLESLRWATRQANVSERKHAKGNQYTRAAERRRVAMLTHTQMEFA